MTLAAREITMRYMANPSPPAPCDYISPRTVTDPDFGITHPEIAVITLDGHSFEASDQGDWRNVLTLASRGVTVGAVPGGAPATAWTTAAKRFARMVVCSCGLANLDPDAEGFDCYLCPSCYDRSGWENAHSDEAHDDQPDPQCPICAESASSAARAGA